MSDPKHLDSSYVADAAYRDDEPDGKGAPSLLLTIVLAIVLTFFVRTFLIDSYEIPSGSMEQTIQVGDRLIAEKVSYRFRNPEPGEIVTFSFTEDGVTNILIKRVIAVEGQTVDLIDGVVYVDGVALDEPYTDGLPSYPLGGAENPISYPVTVPSGCIWVMGDNRTNSRDSRVIGPISVDDVTSRALFIFWPPADIGTI